jgi:hypothetical protein
MLAHLKFSSLVLAIAAGLGMAAIAGSAAAATAPVTERTAATPHASAWQANVWRSPSGNIACRYYPTLVVVTCQTDNDQFALAVSRRGGRAFRTYYRWIPDWANALDYGQRWTAPGFSCRSRTDGMTCRAQAGHGFFITSDSYDVW